SPGFIDAHAHMTPTGLMLGGLDLHGVKDANAMRRMLAAYVRRTKDRFVWGYGWEDTRWPVPPDADQIEPVARARFAYLSRIDGHSALVSWGLLKASGAADEQGCDIGANGRPTGVVRRDAHHAVRRYFLSRLPTAQIRAAHRRAAEAAVAAGITTVHEMGGPLHGAGERDLDLLLEDRLPVSVVCYYASDDVSIPKSRGLKQIGGDFNVDGALGSRTAALRRPYADARPHTGFLYRDSGDLAQLFERATRAGLQAGVHCIGDAGCEAAVEGLEHAARTAGMERLRRLRHRLEHFEMASRELIRRAARVGASFSVQPAFDAAWGGGSGMYATRVGRTRALAMNDFRSMVESGSIVGFGSDSPVTPFDALGSVRAAVKPASSRHALKASQAFYAATAGAAALAREEGATGRIEPGYRADFVVWSGHPLTSKKPSIRATVSRGRVVYGSLS
ncbi:MAG: amidohydrolase, partial [Actinomycetota bacterium]